LGGVRDWEGDGLGIGTAFVRERGWNEGGIGTAFVEEIGKVGS
jgi:hypothetical protein